MSESATPAKPPVMPVLVAALDIVTMVIALFVGVPPWLAAAAAAAVLTAVLVRSGLSPRPRVRALAPIVLAAAVGGFAAEGVRVTFFESKTRGPQAYIVVLPDGLIRPRLYPNIREPELMASPYAAGDLVRVACLKDILDYHWARLQDGTWIQSDDLRLAPGAHEAAKCKAVPAPYVRESYG